jgi:hypothetical protein
MAYEPKTIPIGRLLLDTENPRHGNVPSQKDASSALIASERQKLVVLAMENQHVTRMDRLAAATARVQVLDMPADLLVVVDDANEYVASLGEERTDELKARWPEIYDRLHSAAGLLDVP